MFLCFQESKETAPCYSVHSRFDSKMATLGISKSQIFELPANSEKIVMCCLILIKQHDLREIYFQKRFKSFGVIGGFFKIPLNLFLTIFSPIYPNLSKKRSRLLCSDTLYSQNSSIVTSFEVTFKVPSASIPLPLVLIVTVPPEIVTSPRGALPFSSKPPLFFAEIPSS